MKKVNFSFVNFALLCTVLFIPRIHLYRLGLLFLYEPLSNVFYFLGVVHYVCSNISTLFIIYYPHLTQLVEPDRLSTKI